MSRICREFGFHADVIFVHNEGIMVRRVGADKFWIVGPLLLAVIDLLKDGSNIRWVIRLEEVLKPVPGSSTKSSVGDDLLCNGFAGFREEPNKLICLRPVTTYKKVWSIAIDRPSIYFLDFRAIDKAL